MVGYAPGHVPADFTDYQPEIPLTVCARIVLGHKGHGNVLFRRNLIAVAGQQTGVDGVGDLALFLLGSGYRPRRWRPDSRCPRQM